MELDEVLNVANLAAAVAASAAAFFALRGRHVGFSDFLILAPLTAGAVAPAIWLLYRITTASRSESAAYEGWRLCSGCSA